MVNAPFPQRGSRWVRCIRVVRARHIACFRLTDAVCSSELGVEMYWVSWLLQTGALGPFVVSLAFAKQCSTALNTPHIAVQRYIKKKSLTVQINLVRRCVRVLGIRQPNPPIVSIINRIKPLQERVAVNKVQTLARITAQVCHDEVNGVLLPSNCHIQLSRPDLSVGRECEGRAADNKVQSLERGIASCGDL